MSGDLHLLGFDTAYERKPKTGQNGLRFPLERYLPAENCIDIDDDLKIHTAFRLMGRRCSRMGFCLRCGGEAGQHPRRLCPCQWCGGAAEDAHPDRECPWIYATSRTWSDKLVLRDPSTNLLRSDLVPVSVQIKPTRAEQEILAKLDPRFIDFPYAREGHDLKIPDGVCMRQPSRSLGLLNPHLHPASEPSWTRNRPRDDNTESDQLDEPTIQRRRNEYNQPEDSDEDFEEHVIRLTNVVQDMKKAQHEQDILLAKVVEDMKRAQHELTKVVEDMKMLQRQHPSRDPAGYPAGPHNDGRPAVHGNPAYGGFGQGHHGYHGMNPVIASGYAQPQPAQMTAPHEQTTLPYAANMMAHQGPMTAYPGPTTYPGPMAPYLGQVAPQQMHMPPY